MKNIEWQDRVASRNKTDILTVVKLVLSVVPVSIGLTIAMGNGIGNWTQMTEYILAITLNLLAIPIGIFNLGEFIGFSGLFDFSLFEWNVIAIMWIVMGTMISDAIFSAIGLYKRPIAEPHIGTVAAVNVVPILTAGLIESIYGGGLEMIGKVWLAVYMNVLLLPTIILGDTYSTFGIEQWLGIIGGIVVVILSLGVVGYVFGNSKTFVRGLLDRTGITKLTSSNDR